MLSQLEKHRLLSRGYLDARTRTTNDMRTKRKLSAWLNDIIDAQLIIGGLPADQTRNLISDMHINVLFLVLAAMMRARDFRPMEGKIDEQSKWKVVSLRGLIPTVGGEKPEDLNPPDRPVEDIDIYRAWWIRFNINILEQFVGQNNPINEFGALNEAYNNERLRSRLTEGETEGIIRIAQALHNVSEEVLKESDKRVENMVESTTPKKDMFTHQTKEQPPE
jgi:hypothetical protein